MTVIFKEFIKESLKRISNLINNNKTVSRFVCFAFVALLSLVLSIVVCGIKIGFNVKYSGKNIAVVSSTKIFDEAKGIILDGLQSKNAARAIDEPRFALTITLDDKILDKAALADAIIENTDEISLSSALTVNGEVVAFSERGKLGDQVNAALCKYYVENAQNTSAFVDSVEVVDSFCLTKDMATKEEVETAVNNLQVKTVSTVTTESEVAYSTKTLYTSKELRGYESVETEGVNGLKKETAVVETLNGQETTKTVIERIVLKDPVQKVVVKGTAVPRSSATQRANAKSAGLICPMNKGDISKISSYWGDGRGHQGMDLCGTTGKPIFSAQAGKVTFAGWDGAYGYSVVVDHGNGLKTRYAHASSLCVKKGETVSQGQQIAKVGNTGRSTGPHLHFEVIKNGSRVNPAPYIGY